MSLLCVTPLHKVAQGDSLPWRYLYPLQSAKAEPPWAKRTADTCIDITAQKKAQARLRDIISDLSQRIGNILRRVNKSLHPVIVQLRILHLLSLRNHPRRFFWNAAGI